MMHTLLAVSILFHTFHSSNGDAVNALKPIKNALKRLLGENKERHLNEALNNFLFDYPTTDHATTEYLLPYYLCLAETLGPPFSFTYSTYNDKKYYLQ